MQVTGLPAAEIAKLRPVIATHAVSAGQETDKALQHGTRRPRVASKLGAHAPVNPSQPVTTHLETP